MRQNLSGLLELNLGLREAPLRFGSRAILTELFVACAVGGRHIRRRESAERRAIFEIHCHGGKDDFRAGAQAGLEDFVEVPFEIPIDYLLVGRWGPPGCE